MKKGADTVEANEKLGFEAAATNEAFQRLRDASHEFRDGLISLFFEDSPSLSTLMKSAGEHAKILGGLALEFREETGWAQRADQRAALLRHESTDRVATEINGGGR